jgi:GT2 family glycosyltransferase
MNAAAIVVGFNHWYGESLYDKTFTRDFVTRLADDNPDLAILLIDNFSGRPYPTSIAPNVTTHRTLRRVGYAVALNAGLRHFADQAAYDWYVCFNNDCWIDPLHSGNITGMLATFHPRVVYGSGPNTDKQRKTVLQWSAWLCISHECLQAVGLFDEALAAAFEDFDYELRATAEGFTLETARFPIVHLDEHTRFEDKNYPAGWEKARIYFSLKHGMEMERWFKV